MTIGDEECQKVSVTENEILCTPPLNPPGGTLQPEIRVSLYGTWRLLLVY